MGVTLKVHLGQNADRHADRLAPVEAATTPPRSALITSICGGTAGSSQRKYWSHGQSINWLVWHRIMNAGSGLMRCALQSAW